MKYLITGGLGFIGSEVVRQLLAKPDTEFIYIIDNNSKHSTKNELSFDKNDKRVYIDSSDLSDRQDYLMRCGFIENFARQVTIPEKWHNLEETHPDIVIHLAAKIGGIAYFHKYPYTILDENNKILSNVLLELKENHFKGRFVYISSSMVFENADLYPTPESYISKCPIPQSAYGFSKLSGEFYCRAFCDENKLDYIICRPFNAYGTNEYPEEVGMAHVIPDIVRKIEEGQGTDKPLEILGDGAQVRCYTHVEDVADGIITAALTAKSGEDFNISIAEPTSVIDLVKKIWEIMKPGLLFNRVPIQNITPFLHDVKMRVPSTEKALQQLGWKAKYSLDSKLPETIKWVRKVVNVKKTDCPPTHCSRGR